MTLAIFGLVAFLHGDAGSLPRLLQRMAEIVESSRGKLPQWLGHASRRCDRSPGRRHPVAAASMRRSCAPWAARWALGFVHVADRHGDRRDGLAARGGAAARMRGPLTRELSERARRLGDAFRRVVFAQVRISALNTFFTAIYLLAVLPLVRRAPAVREDARRRDVPRGPAAGPGQPHLQHRDRGREPVASRSSVPSRSLVFLVVIHKLEYFLNARIVGSADPGARRGSSCSRCW